MPVAARFDVRDYARTAHGSLRGDFDRAEFEGFPLDREAIIATAYLRALESAAAGRIPPVRAETRLATFFEAWAEEKQWIAQALADVLDASPRIRGVQAPTPAPPRRSRRLLNALFAEELLAARLAAGAVDAHAMMRGYHHLAHLSLHPEMERLAGAIIRILDRHAEFFLDEAQARLSGSARARLVTRVLLETGHLPIGEADLPAPLAQVGRALLFARDRRGLTRIDRGLSKRLGVPSTAARRLTRPAAGADVRLARWIGAFAADIVDAYRTASV
ncbi:hypothetical protein HQQ80_11210 [Microbacteriaceae bacterium VKM Ac-2855]|nr:hypothetical protein [Microbacteriaceae bacterium VKM Ac-2855]